MKTHIMRLKRRLEIIKKNVEKLNLRFYLESLSEIKYWLGLNRIEVDVYVVIEL